MSRLLEVIDPPIGEPVPTCERCGQQHRTHAAYLLDGIVVGHPCLESVDELSKEDVARWRAENLDLTPSIDILKDTEQAVIDYACRLDADPNALTEEQAGWVRATRWPLVEKSKVPALFDLLAEFIQQAGATSNSPPLETGNWLGEVKARLELSVRVVKITGPHVGEFGDSWLCVMETTNTTEPELCVWWTGDNLAFDEKKEYNIRGTVKKLDVYNGRRQTHLSRVKEVIK